MPGRCSAEGEHRTPIDREQASNSDLRREPAPNFAVARAVILLAKAGLMECVSSLAETFVVPKPVADELFHEALRRAGEQP